MTRDPLCQQSDSRELVPLSEVSRLLRARAAAWNDGDLGIQVIEEAVTFLEEEFGLQRNGVPALTILWEDENDCWHHMGLWSEADRSHAEHAFISFTVGGRVKRKVLAAIEVLATGGDEGC